ncbi:DUF349 domain-containing protein [Demequina sp.]|uniref:DUF349 domain-containing protein n=1 Tax=Demequina sp. TaxID=2050685 RepID=UPI003D0D5D62
MSSQDASETTPAAATEAAPATPKPRPVPKPGSFKAPSPAVVAAHATHPVKVPVAADVSDEDKAAAAAFGTVADDVVSVKDGKDTHEVGPAQGDEPLTPYVRAYFDLKASVERLGARLTASELSIKDIDDALATIRTALAEPKVVGDLAALRAEFTPIEADAVAARDALAEERRKARAEALERREQIVARAEEIAAAPVASVHWKNDTTELRSLLDSWKEAQRDGARIPKDVERELWKRFTHARTSFEKARKHHFNEVDGANAAVASRKEALVARAEALTASGDFEKGAREFRDLMNEWRAAGRGRRSVDDALWKRFQAAQDGFFNARRTQAEAEEAALAPNIEAAEAAVKAAEGALPIKDLAAAKSTLRSAQDAFEAAGRLPRAEASALSKRIGAVERAVRDAEDSAWNSSSPELAARLSGATAQLHAAIADLEDKLAAAKTPAEKKTLKESLDARKAWLKQIEG